ncbi:hypothetical protein HPP92_000513 [Vanilla planifolia]|uniref:Uncharacterized protein n=1 Tax=Vanilla planifolia TaxID=51239 RepID=A0A835S1I0_VANPL|nr:hypothetical protein HPP92_000513 [Vanilla planifolia]
MVRFILLCWGSVEWGESKRGRPNVYFRPETYWVAEGVAGVVGREMRNVFPANWSSRSAKEVERSLVFPGEGFGETRNLPWKRLEAAGRERRRGEREAASGEKQG